MWSWETVSLRMKEPKLSFKNLFLSDSLGSFIRSETVSQDHTLKISL